VVDKYSVTQFYTAPTAIRSLMRAGDAPVKSSRRTSLRLLGTVGEPINPAAWEWYQKNGWRQSPQEPFAGQKLKKKWLATVGARSSTLTGRRKLEVTC